jgi:rSAM/selenodomain-associated transferase 1
VGGGRCALAVMSKAPRPGKVKTRLSPPLTAAQAADLNICFLRDTTENIFAVSQASHSTGLVVYTPVGDEAAFEGLLPSGFPLLAQRGDGFGERLLAAAEDLFAVGFGSVCLIDSDSPTMPQAALREAVERLSRPGDRVVLGGSDDGGYYLIGIKHAHPELFARIDWSTERVLRQTLERAAEINLEVEQLTPWYDVDDAATLERLRRELLQRAGPSPGYDARHTRAYLESLPATEPAAPAVTRAW